MQQLCDGVAPLQRGLNEEDVDTDSGMAFTHEAQDWQMCMPAMHEIGIALKLCGCVW